MFNSSLIHSKNSNTFISHSLQRCLPLLDLLSSMIKSPWLAGKKAHSASNTNMKICINKMNSFISLHWMDKTYISNQNLKFATKFSLKHFFLLLYSFQSFLSRSARTIMESPMSVDKLYQMETN